MTYFKRMTMIRKIICFFTLTFSLTGLLPFTVSGQIQHGGEPMSWRVRGVVTEVSFKTMPKVPVQKLKAEDRKKTQEGLKPLRFAYNHSVDINPSNSGKISYTSNGGRIWRVGVSSPAAYSLSFGFKEYDLAKGTRLFIFDEERDQLLGAFTHQNNKSSGILATTLIESDKAIIEFYEPPEAIGKSELSLGRVSHAYRDVIQIAKEKSGRGYGDAGSCNMNVNCPDGQTWQEQKRAVALIIENGNRLCTGALVNNTLEDGTPYFLTANHCFSSNASNWVFMFNYESPNCTDQNGPTNQTVSGSTLMAKNPDSDFCLVEMSSQPPASYNPYYAGWDHSGNTPSTSVGIHHPNGDIKKISFDDDAPTSAQFGSSIANGEWKINSWDRNTTTEPGSSGSPLFDQDHRVIGQLHGGYAACSNNQEDYYGKFSVSWDTAGSSSGRLKDWLDPNNSGTAILDGLDPFGVQYADDGALSEVSGLEVANCGVDQVAPLVKFKNNGTDTLTSLEINYDLNSSQTGSVSWTGYLPSGSYDTIALPSLNLDSGTNYLTVYSSQPNGNSDQKKNNDTLSLSFTASPSGVSLDHTLKTDCWGSEISWEIIDDQGNTVYSGGPYSDSNSGENIFKSLCLDEGCYDYIIYDSYGDGLLGSVNSGCSVDGYYHILNESGDTLVNMGSSPNFGNDTTHSFCVGQITSIREKNNIAGSAIYPNPTEGKFQLHFGQKDPQMVDVTIRDLTGRMLHSTKVRIGGSNIPSIDLNDASPGIYLVKINKGSSTIVKKVQILEH